MKEHAREDKVTSDGGKKGGSRGSTHGRLVPGLDSNTPSRIVQERRLQESTVTRGKRVGIVTAARGMDILTAIARNRQRESIRSYRATSLEGRKRCRR